MLLERETARSRNVKRLLVSVVVVHKASVKECI
jgi:hypothetical protein